MERRALWAAVLAAAACLLLAPTTHADLIGYWPLDATSGTTAHNAMPWGITGTLYNGSAVGSGPAWVNDATRGQVLSFDGSDDWVHAGSIPSIPVGSDFTWSFWTYQQQGANNDVALGNRFGGGPNQSFVKFTPRAFEYRPTIWTSNDIDYPDIPQNQWVHHAVVKTGPTLTYYRNGFVTATSTATATVPALPFYIGGDRAGERWQGRIDDVAIWDHALSAGEVQQLANGTATPLDIPSGLPKPLKLVFSDDFSSPTLDATRWTVLQYGLESPRVGHPGTIAGGVADTTTNPGQLTLGGTASGQYWPGMTVRSAQAFDASLETILAVRRVSLSGSGSAWRSSIWLWGDDHHIIHFGQNVGENGWEWNAEDAGGIGTDDPYGSGNNIGALDNLDGTYDAVEMAIHWMPTGAGVSQVALYCNGAQVASHVVSNFPDHFYFMLSGMPRANGDTVTAVFDDARVYVVPEPATLGLVALGLGVLARRRGRGRGTPAA